ALPSTTSSVARPFGRSVRVLRPAIAKSCAVDPALTTTNRTRPGGALRRDSVYEKSRATTLTTTGRRGEPVAHAVAAKPAPARASRRTRLRSARMRADDTDRTRRSAHTAPGRPVRVARSVRSPSGPPGGLVLGDLERRCRLDLRERGAGFGADTDDDPVPALQVGQADHGRHLPRPAQVDRRAADRERLVPRLPDEQPQGA